MNATDILQSLANQNKLLREQLEAERTDNETLRAHVKALSQINVNLVVDNAVNLLVKPKEVICKLDNIWLTDKFIFDADQDNQNNKYFDILDMEEYLNGDHSSVPPAITEHITEFLGEYYNEAV